MIDLIKKEIRHLNLIKMTILISPLIFTIPIYSLSEMNFGLGLTISNYFIYIVVGFGFIITNLLKWLFFSKKSIQKVIVFFLKKQFYKGESREIALSKLKTFYSDTFLEELIISVLKNSLGKFVILGGVNSVILIFAMLIFYITSNFKIYLILAMVTFVNGFFLKVSFEKIATLTKMVADNYNFKD